MSKLAYTPKEAAAEVAVPVDRIKEAVRVRELSARDAEGQPVILHDDLAAWSLTLPPWDR